MYTVCFLHFYHQDCGEVDAHKNCFKLQAREYSESVCVILVYNTCILLILKRSLAERTTTACYQWSGPKMSIIRVCLHNTQSTCDKIS